MKITRKHKKVTKEAPKNIQFKDNEIYSLRDIGSCVSSLMINNCPIFSLKGLNNFELIKTFNVKNGLIFSFKDAGAIKKIENISFEGCPITKYPNYRLMVLLFFTTNDTKIKCIDSSPVTEEERTIVKNCLKSFASLGSSESSLLQSYLKNGGIIRTINDLSPDVIRRKIAPNIQPPTDIKDSSLSSLTFSPFLTSNAIQDVVTLKTNQLASSSIEKKMCDYQNDLRSYQIEFDDIFAEFDLNDSSIPVAPLYQRIRNVYEKVHQCIDKIENSVFRNDVSQEINSTKNLLEAIKIIMKIYEDKETNLKNYLSEKMENCQNSSSSLTNSKIAPYCQDYINILKQIVDVISNILNQKDFSIDFAFTNISKISEINTSFTPPYRKILDKIFDLIKGLLSSFKENSTQKHIITLFNKVSFYRKRPLFSHFDQILEQVAMIQSCLSGAQNDGKENTLIEISEICQETMNNDIFTIYTNRISTDEMIKNIEESRRSFILSVISFRRTAKYSFLLPKIQKLNEKTFVRSKNLEQYIIDYKKYLDENQVITTYIKDRIFDFSNSIINNDYISLMLKIKTDESNRQKKPAEELPKPVE